MKLTDAQRKAKNPMPAKKLQGRTTALPTKGEGYHSRGYLPHFDRSGLYQAITYRLWDSLPGSAGVPPASPPQTDKEKIERRKQIEQELNKGYGSCILKENKCAKIVVDAWKYFDGKRYDLVAYVVMPNHVHLLIKTYEGFPLSKIIHSWKSFTAHEINKHLKPKEICGQNARAPKVWQHEYFDRFIRDEEHFAQAITYIHENPVKAGLCHHPRKWPQSSSSVKKGGHV